MSILKILLQRRVECCYIGTDLSEYVSHGIILTAAYFSPRVLLGKEAVKKAREGKSERCKPASGSATGWQSFIKYFSVPQFPVVRSGNQSH